MKVVLLCDFFGKDLGYLENTLHKYIVKHGHDLTIATSACDNVFDFYQGRHPRRAQASIDRADGATLVRLPLLFNIANRLLYLSGFRRLLEEERPDAVVMLDVMPNLLDVVAYKRRYPECRFVMHSTMDASNSGRNWLSRSILHRGVRRWLLGRARPFLDGIFPTSPHTASFLRAHYDLREDEMDLIPLGFDKPPASDREEVRSSLGYSARDIVLLTGGKLGPLKRTELAIEVVRQLPDLPLKLIVVGAPEAGAEQYYDDLVKMAGRDARVRFTSWVGDDEIRRLMSAADIAVFPASQSALWILAVTMGLPLVVGDSGGQDASYLNRASNVVVLPADRITVDGLSAAIAPIALDPDLRARMAAGATEVAATFLNWDRSIAKVLGTEREPVQRA